LGEVRRALSLIELPEPHRKHNRGSPVDCLLVVWAGPMP
jgi:hypothetical protein